jgi:preprotein translocase SecE subunit
MEQVQAPQTQGRIAGAFVSVRDFIADVRVEMRKVSWPTQDELKDATKRVVLMTLAIGTAIGLLDLVLKKILVDGIAALTR